MGRKVGERNRVRESERTAISRMLSSDCSVSTHTATAPQQAAARETVIQSALFSLMMARWSPPVQPRTHRAWRRADTRRVSWR